MNHEIDKFLYNAIEEEMPQGDIASDLLLANKTLEAILIADENIIVSGVEIMRRLLMIVDDSVYVKVINFDGTYVEKGDIIAILSGNANSIVKCEKLLMNIIGRMSGIAMLTNEYVNHIQNTNTKILDTRNTTPGFNVIEKEAVKHGGGINHYANLTNHAIVKNIHIDEHDSIENVVTLVSESIDQDVKIQLHVSSFEQFLDAINTNCDIIVLDDFKIDQIRKCVSHNKGKLLIANSEITLENISDYAATRIDFIKVEAITSKYTSRSVKLKYNK